MPRLACVLVLEDVDVMLGSQADGPAVSEAAARRGTMLSGRRAEEQGRQEWIAAGQASVG